MASNDPDWGLMKMGRKSLYTQFYQRVGTVGAKALSKPMLDYCQLDPQEQTSVNF